MRLKKIPFLTAAALAVSTTMLAPGALAAGSLSGAGSSLIAPVEAEWGVGFQNAYGVGISYATVGSQAGIAEISARAVDFGASEGPLSASQATACHGCFQIPWALSAIGVSYHVSGIGSNLHLSGQVLAEIYLGQISRWNDARIRALNPALHLPSLKITPIYATGSGDTYAFTDYLAKISRTWRKTVGHGMSVAFPTGTPGNGSLAVTALLESTDGSIAYVGVSYLIAHRLPAAAIQNAAGSYEYPNLVNIESAGRSVTRVPLSNELHIVDPPRSARSAYPISTYVYVIVPANAAQKALLRRWILYAIGAGRQFDPALDFAPLAPSVLRATKASVSGFSSSH